MVKTAWLVIGFVAGVAVTGGAWAGSPWHFGEMTQLGAFARWIVPRLECETSGRYGPTDGGTWYGGFSGKTTCTVSLR